jgi:hypothetical protein
MDRMEAIAWVLSLCASLRLSQAKTLSDLVGAALGCPRISLAAIGRRLRGKTTKHDIKRCWRFCANSRIETADALRGVVAKLVKRHKKPLLVSLDWTDIRSFQSLMACASFQGRAVPLCWASCLKHVYEGHKSRNSFEESLLLVLRSMIPEGQKVILLADRGFARTELARFCQEQHFDYVIRINPNVHVRSETYTGKLLDYPVYKGICKLLRSVAYRSHHSVTQTIVVRWVRELPKDRDECWFLMTSLAAGPAQLSRLYGQRMTIEEFFRDHKSKRNGWSLRDTQLTRPDRLDRLLLILALAYVLLCGLGLWALKRRSPRQWCSNNRRGECSVFVIGQTLLERIQVKPATAWAALVAATEKAVPNWG